jgi:zeta-carotene desaturase
MNAALAFPTVGLSQLYVDGAKHFITLYGGEIHCNADVVGVSVDTGPANGVKLKGGDEVRADAIILAVPPHKLIPMLPDQLKQTLSSVANLDSAPIVSIHLWFNEEFMVHEFVGLIGKRIQWLFNKRKINNEHVKGAHVSAVISGAYGFVDKTKDELVKTAVDDIREVYRNLRGEPFHAVVVREKSATYSSSPETERLRPSNETEISNLFLAGDWTATGYPATIEGAILSADRASRGVLAYLG